MERQYLFTYLPDVNGPLAKEMPSSAIAAMGVFRKGGSGNTKESSSQLFIGLAPPLLL